MSLYSSMYAKRPPSVSFRFEINGPKGGRRYPVAQYKMQSAKRLHDVSERMSKQAGFADASILADEFVSYVRNP